MKILRHFNKPQVIIVSSLIIVYLATLTRDYYWDGITFALQIEKVANEGRSAYLLFHQNHLLYNALGYLLYQAANVFGSNIRALDLLQIANPFLGALAVGVFFRIAERATCNLYIAVVCSAALAVSAAWWRLSTDADAYVLTLLLILISANNLLGARPGWFAAGLALAGAMLIHQLASLFYPAALVAVLTNRNIERKLMFASLMSAVAIALPVSVYYVCAAVLHGLARPLDVVKWATSNPSLMPVAKNPVNGLAAFPRLNFDAIIGHSFALFRQQNYWLELVIAIAAILIALLFVLTVMRKTDVGRAIKSLKQPAIEMSNERKQFAPVLIVWIATYVLFLLFWVPLIYYRVFYTPAIILVIGLALSNYHKVTGAKPAGAAALAVIALALSNLAFYIGPYMRAESNPLVIAARSANSLWDERTQIYFANRNEADTAFEYFNPQTNWRRLTPAARLALEAELDLINKQGGSLWINKGAAESVDADWLSGHAAGKEIEISTSHGHARYMQLLPQE